MEKAFLILEDGTIFKGQSIGAKKQVISEIVFNTTMAGYTEVFTDPSYAGQAVCMTYPIIGSFGVCIDDMESDRIWLDGVIVREISEVSSNFRSDMTITEFLEKYDIPGIAGIDTRKLTRLLREKGTMNGCITTDENFDLDNLISEMKKYTTKGVVEKVSCKEKYEVKGSKTLEENGPISGSASFNKEDYDKYLNGDKTKKEHRPSLVRELNGAGLKVALMDFGAKRNIAYELAKRGCDVSVYPYNTSAEEILSDNPDGIMLSNGPGDPKDCEGVIKEVKKLYESNVPIFAICLGHQLMALANGIDTYKLKYGHRGGNHPVMELSTGKTYISSQNHGYVVDTENLDKEKAVPAYINVNDKTNEGLKYTGKNIYTVQFHPEACAGPQDTGTLFDYFINMMKNGEFKS